MWREVILPAYGGVRGRVERHRYAEPAAEKTTDRDPADITNQALPTPAPWSVPCPEYGRPGSETLGGVLTAVLRLILEIWAGRSRRPRERETPEWSTSASGPNGATLRLLTTVPSWAR